MGCDAQPGTEIMMTGPTGQVMLLPKDPSTPVIMVATGTGIAPMRAYIRRFFVEDIPHGVRLYSIASTRYGDSFDGKTATLCVRRATYWDEEMGAEDPAKKGICSNFLCDAQPGTEIMMTGPTGQVMLLPKDPSTP